ncbi:MAG: S8 family serine peptidase [Candidatus Bathyarchaeia archaeon]
MVSARVARKTVAALLILVAISTLIQAVGAIYFFDPQVSLRLKAAPGLRVFLAEPLVQTNSRVSVLLVFSDIPSPEQMRQLAEFGKLETFTGHVASMRLPMSVLPQVASLDFVSHISYPRMLSPSLDKSVPDILADQVWSTVRDANGNLVNGTGVVVGIVDSGIDLTHKDFFFPNGTSKIMSLWDQTGAGKPPDGFDYGNECTRQQIEQETCGELDGSESLPAGHGTAVAAVAASTGQAAMQLQSCILYDESGWHDEHTQCQGLSGPFPLLSSSSDYLYFGDSQKFNQLFFDTQSAGAYEGFTWEYSQGMGSWGPLPRLPENRDLALTGPGFSDNDTLRLTRSGTIFFTPPLDWSKDSVGGNADQYWIRLKATYVGKPALVRRIQASPPYKGVAPEALIIAVKVTPTNGRGGSLSEGTDATALDGVNYIMKKARELGLPFVVNFSLGDSLGSHDGSEPLETAFADLASQGVPIVVSAGNSRNANQHVDGTLTAGESTVVTWTNNPINSPNYIDIWYPVSDVLKITVTTPDDTVVSGPTSEYGVTTPSGNVTILPDQRSSGKEWFITVAAVNSLRWHFTLTASSAIDGKWDAWTEGESDSGVFEAPTLLTGPYKLDPSDTIDYPGTAKGVITVGGYMTKYFWWSGCTMCIEHWVDYSQQQNYLVHGIIHDSYAPSVGSITDDSAMGPTRDGRTKPEIVAPSANIAAARASSKPQCGGGTSCLLFSDPDDYHRIVIGTSFSAAHVTGVIALMLQMNHYLSPNQIRNILTQDARQDAFTGEINSQSGSPTWGWGKVNALNSTLDAAKVYAARVEVDSIGVPLETNVSLDGQEASEVSLDQARTIIYEFQRGGNHTIQLTSLIQAQPGSRYLLMEPTWIFSTGGSKQFHYTQQFHIQATSAYGYATGTGWYDANSTVIVSVTPSQTAGHEFRGWIGDVISNSPVVEVKVDSSKEMTATWRSTQGAYNVANVAGFLLAIIFSIAVVLIVRYNTRKRKLVEP